MRQVSLQYCCVIVKLTLAYLPPFNRGWKWHLLTTECVVGVAKASTGHNPLPFLISNVKSGAKIAVSVLYFQIFF